MNDVLHVLAAGAWLGALLPVAMVMKTNDSYPSRGLNILALQRFSTAGHFCVPVAVASGFANIYFVLGHWPINVRSPYQLLLMSKILIVSTMIVLAVFNRDVILPRIRQAREGSVLQLKRAINFEVLLGIIIVGLLSVFGALDPE